MKIDQHLEGPPLVVPFLSQLTHIFSAYAKSEEQSPYFLALLIVGGYGLWLSGYIMPGGIQGHADRSIAR
jgi:hypothetical protein